MFCMTERRRRYRMLLQLLTLHMHAWKSNSLFGQLKAALLRRFCLIFNRLLAINRGLFIGTNLYSLPSLAGRSKCMPLRAGSSTVSRSPSHSSPIVSPTSTAPISSQRAKSNSTVSSSEHLNHWTGIDFAISVLELV